ncbi:PTS sugar transporter subunit IIA [Rhodovastum atsumiense]|uniref:PTS sugar transporter subunit IIA n=2 Tax=Rhodovastum atsumiense TaxID=504468 RepID=A0A5M6IT04_9PROT|nr:PTS sugar transporter subunit IIA [Rhodovastum atsumiense]
MIPPHHVLDRLRAADKPALLAELGRRAEAVFGLSAPVVAAALAAREALGSTGVGAGIALPHARLEGVPGPVGFLVRLDRPLDYDAVDGRPVDLLVLLLSPPEDNGHLQALAAVSRRLRDPAAAAALRKAPDAAALRDIFVGG